MKWRSGLGLEDGGGSSLWDHEMKHSLSYLFTELVFVSFVYLYFLIICFAITHTIFHTKT